MSIDDIGNFPLSHLHFWHFSASMAPPLVFPRHISRPFDSVLYLVIWNVVVLLSGINEAHTSRKIGITSAPWIWDRTFLGMIAGQHNL